MVESKATPPRRDEEEKRAEWLEMPVYITGLMKSGTTLLLALLDGHPNILAYPDEPSFSRLWARRYDDAEHLIADWLFGNPNPLHFGRMIWKRGLNPASVNLLGRTKPFSAFFRTGKPMSSSLSVRMPDRDDLIGGTALRGLPEDAENHRFIAVYHEALDRILRDESEIDARDAALAAVKALKAAYPDPVDPHRWLFKQPQPWFRGHEFETFFEHFPKGKCIVLLRDPRGQFCSRKAAYLVKGKGLLSEVLYFISRTASLESDYLNYTALPERFGATQIFFVHYEDIILDTETAMRGISEFLGVNYCSALLRPTKLGRPVNVHTATQDGGGTVFVESLQRWRTDLSHWEIALVEANIEKVFEADGAYSPTTPRYSRMALRAMMAPLSAMVRTAIQVYYKLVYKNPAQTGGLTGRDVVASSRPEPAIPPPRPE